VPKQISQERSHLDGRNVRPLTGFNPADYAALSQIGIELLPSQIAAMALASYNSAMDALTPGLTTPSVPTPIQYLQNWLPGFIQVVTAARKIDSIVGITTAGAWEDESIVQGIMELDGTSVPYGDYTNIPLSSWNVNFEERTVIRFEEGMRVGVLEDARASRIRVNSAASKRESATLALEIQRNSIGFYGYNGGANLTYGFLNDPAEPAFVLLPNGALGSPNWSMKTFIEITADIRNAVASLRTSTGEIVDPDRDDMTLAVATASVDYLSVTALYGDTSVRQWLTETYPKIRIVSAPELDAANAGDNVFYLFADKVKDTSTDDGRTFIQVVPTKFRVIGVQPMAKGYMEDYGNATAGVWCKRPFAMVRYYGC
jgi:hypothetical protein